MSEPPEDDGPRLTEQEATRRFYILLWPHAATVLRVARILTGNEAEAEDLAQEAMLKAFRAIEKFEEGTDARAWLLAILRNVRIDRLRSGAASAGDLSLESLPLEAAAAEAAVQPVGEREWQRPQEILSAFSDQEFIDALKQLPEQIRWTLLLVDVEGVDHHEAAQVLEVPVGTIKSRAHRGRAMLRDVLLQVARRARIVSEDDRQDDGSGGQRRK